MNDNLLCTYCDHPKNKHAFDVVITKKENPCRMSCLICFDEETERLKKRKLYTVTGMETVNDERQ